MSISPDRLASSLLSDAPLGVVTATDQSLQVVFNRHYRASVERVWAALTTPERLADWLAEATVDLRVGGTIRLKWNGAYETDVRITACDPPTTLAWIWTLDGRDTLVRFDLATDGGGCRLTLTHSGLSPHNGSGAGVRAGWHAHLEGLPDAIEGRLTRWDVKVAREAALEDLYPRLPD